MILKLVSLFPVIFEFTKVFYSQAFIAGDITFAMKPYFRGPFCTQDVREGFVVTFLRHITHVCDVSFRCTV